MPVNERTLRLSPLRHTWILDLDGTLLRHNGYKSGQDEWLPGALDFLKLIPLGDFIIILTAREKAAQGRTELFLREAGVRFDIILFEMPTGERILFNDVKPSGLKCAHLVDPDRDVGLEGIQLIFDTSL